MTEPITYSLNFGMSNLNLQLTDDRFVSRGAMQNVDVPLSALRNFCIVPTTNSAGAYDSELIISWDEGGTQKSRKIYVRRSDASFQQLLTALQQKRPDASLLHLDPKSAQKQMGVLSTNKFAWIVALGIVGLVLVIAIVVGIMR